MGPLRPSHSPISKGKKVRSVSPLGGAGEVSKAELGCDINSAATEAAVGAVGLDDPMSTI